MRFFAIFTVIASLSAVISSASISTARTDGKNQITDIITLTEPRKLFQGFTLFKIYIEELSKAKKQAQLEKNFNQITQTYYVNGVCKFVRSSAAPKSAKDRFKGLIPHKYFMLSEAQSYDLRDGLKYLGIIQYFIKNDVVPMYAKFEKQFSNQALPSVSTLYLTYSSSKFKDFIEEHEYPDIGSKQPLKKYFDEMSF